MRLPSSRKRGAMVAGRTGLWLPVFAGVALAGCRGEAPVDPDTLIACQQAERSAFKRECTAERSEGRYGTILTLRRPDGGFRRLLIAGDGQGVIAADGAEVAEVRMSGDSEIEVMIGGDRYRLPAQPKPVAETAP
ncbi:MAG: hypothetical protein AB7G25_07165 [Sphingomonadaceae bacterium]